MQSYHYKCGDIVEVHNHTMGGKPFVEGNAKVVSLGDMPNQYMVRFLADRSAVYSRFVYPPEDLAREAEKVEFIGEADPYERD